MVIKRFLNILVVSIFINFLAFPSVAKVFDIDIPMTNIVLSEEETSIANGLIISEKTIPKTLCIHDFIKFFTSENTKIKFTLTNDDIFLAPYISIFSPPPEFLL